MTIAKRMILTVVLFGAVIGVAMPLLSQRREIAGLVIVLGLWKIARDAYLMRWRVEFDELSITLTKGKHPINKLQYMEICRVQTLWPSVRMLIIHLRERPEIERVTAGFSYRIALPIEMEWSHALRRLWTFTGDLLIQSDSGVTMFIPLGAMGRSTRRELWIQLRVKVAPNVFQVEESILRRASEEEDKANGLFLARRWDQAREHFEGAAELWKKAGHIDSMARCVQHIADCLLHLGRYSEAGGLAAEALKVARNLGDCRNVAYGLNQLAHVEWIIGEQGALDKAYEYLDEARNLYGRLRMAFMECMMLGNQAINREQAFLLTGETKYLEECQSKAETGLTILQTRVRHSRKAEARAQEANLLGSLARSHFHRREFERASARFESASNILQSAGHGMIVDDLAMWGRTLFILSRYNSPSESENGEQLRRVDEAMRKLDGAVRAAQIHGGFNELIQVYSLRGDTFWDMGNLEAAVRDYEIVISLLESGRFLLARPYDRVALLRRYRCAYTKTVEALVRMAHTDRARASELAERAFQHCERAKARNLAEALSLRTILLPRIPDCLRREFEAAEQNLRISYVHMDRLQKQIFQKQDHHEGSNSSNSFEAWEELQRAQKYYDQVCKKVMDSAPEFLELVSPGVPSLSDVQSWLPRDNAAGVLEFCVGENALIGFIITREKKTFWMVDGLGSRAMEETFFRQGYLHEYELYARRRQEVERLEGEYFHRWCGCQSGSDADCSEDLGSLESRLEEMLEDLERLRLQWIKRLPDLIETVRRKILDARTSGGDSLKEMLNKCNIRQLVIIPDGILHRLPIHVVLENLDVCYAPSSAVLINTITRSTEIPATAALVVANPEHRVGIFSYELREAEKEADLVEMRLQTRQVRVIRLEGTDANSHSIITNMRTRPLIHFAVHAVSNLRSPLESYLRVCRANGEWEVGFLRAGTVMAEGTVQQGAWVVASACEVGVSPSDPSGEYLGWPAAFLMAGAAIVISPLWEVHAGTPIVIMDRFYENVFERGLEPPAALREACNYLRRMTIDDIRRFEDNARIDPNTILRCDEAQRFPPDHPWHFAPFVLCGAAWSADDVQSDVQRLGSHKQKLPDIPFHVDGGLPPQVVEDLKKAGSLIAGKAFSEAISFVEGILKEWGPSPALHESLGTCYVELRDFDNACRQYLEVLRYDSNSFLNHYNLGCVYRDFAHVANARECFQKALQLNPGCVNALLNLSELTNEPQEALEYLKRAMLIEPNEVRRKGIDEAIAMWQGLSRADRAAVALHRIVWAAKSLDEGDLSRARLHLALARQEALEDQVKAMAFRIESDILKREGDLEGAITALEAAVILDPSRPAHWNTLGARKLLLSENPELPALERSILLDQAREECLKAISLADYAKPHQNLAIIYLRLGRLDEAKEQALTAYHMAQQKAKPVSPGGLICKGCPTEGKASTECAECLRKAHGILRDIELASGDYQIG